LPKRLHSRQNAADGEKPPLGLPKRLHSCQNAADGEK
jgi:hypothetical protein